jgi:lipoic acid synthetase
MMLGLGETREEVRAVMADLREVDCEILTVGQYLPPSRRHLPAVRFAPPQEFEELAATGRELGFRAVAAGPRVRSSYRAEELVRC